QRPGRWVVVHAPEQGPRPEDRPAVCRLLPLEGHLPAAELRSRAFHGQSIEGLVCPAAARYLFRHGLFSTQLSPRPVLYRLDGPPRLMLLADEKNERARRMREPFERWGTSDPELILVLGGDGTMLRAIWEHWRLRLPFFGINLGHLGFLMNEPGKEPWQE